MNSTALSRDYWTRIWHARHFLLCIVHLELRNRYKRSILGIGWSLLHPLLMMVVLCTVFHTIFNVDLREYAPFVVAGIGIWAFLSNSITEGCQTIFNSEKFIRSHPMPLALYSLRTLMSVGIQFVIVLTLAFCITLITKGYEQPLALVGVIPSLIILAFFGWSMAVLFGFINVYFPDTQHIAAVILQILYYLTPIFYPPDLIRAPIVQKILRYNPLAAYVDIVRDPIVYSRLPSVENFAYAALVTLILVILSLRALSKHERTIIFHL